MAAPTTHPDPEPPRGTLAIVSIYAGVFVVGWLLIFLFIYIRRGA